MKKMIMLFVASLFAVSTSAQGTAPYLTPTPESGSIIANVQVIKVDSAPLVSATITILGKIDNNHRIMSLYDEKGATITSFAVPRRKGLKKNPIYQDVKYILSDNKKYIAIYIERKIPLSKEQHYHTGRVFDDVNDIFLIDSEGNRIFTKTNVSYLPYYITSNGEYVACLIGQIGYFEGVDPELEKNPPKSKLILLNQNGKEIYRIEDYQISGPSIRVSENGRWVFYGSASNMFSDKIKDSITNKIYDLGRLGVQVYEIYNDGSLLKDKYDSHKNDYYKEHVNLIK